MSLNVKPGYVNPLTMMGKKSNSFHSKNPLDVQEKKSREVEDLQNQRQSLQNEILLRKSTSNGAIASGGTEKALEEKLEQVTSQLQTAKSQEIRNGGSEADTNAMKVAEKAKYDTYEHNEAWEESPGLYQIEPDEEKGYKVSY